MGVTPHYKMYEHDGVRGPNMATVFSDRGGGVRAPVVFYNRSNEAAQQLKPGDSVVFKPFISVNVVPIDAGAKLVVFKVPGCLTGELMKDGGVAASGSDWER